MRRAKYLLFLLVLTAAVFGLAAVASAAVFSDVKGTKYQTPVDALSALGIVTGYPDGTIKPDQTITRAEFCAIVARELGLSADVAPTGTQFSDVTASHWASGLISVAAGQGLVKGYPDGTFKPDNPVTYAEAITILVRMLGYGPAMDESAWPAPYLAKAAQKGVTAGVSVKPNDPAPRGDVFIMAYNSLDADVMKQETWGTEVRWTESKDFKDTILYDKLDIDRVGDEDDPVRVTETPSVNKSLDDDRFIVGSNDERTKSEHPYGSKFGDYKVAKGINPNDYLWLEVELWVDDKTNTVKWIRVHTSPSDIISDIVDEVTYDTSGTYAKRFKMLNSGKEYDLADSVRAYMNTLQVDDSGKIKNVTRKFNTSGYGASNDQKDVVDFLGRSIRAILDDNGKISFIECYKGNSRVVTSVDVENKKIKCFYDTDAEETIDLSDNDRFIVVRDGKPATLADIKKDDLVNVYPDPKFDKIGGSLVSYDDVRIVKVSSAKATGRVEDVFSNGGSVDDYVLVVGGKQYPIIGDIYEHDYWIDALQTVSFDGNETVEQIDEDDIEDLIGKDVTLYLIGTSVRHVVTTEGAAAPTDIYGVMTQADYNAFDKLRFSVVNRDGNSVTYYATDDTQYYDETPNNAILGGYAAWTGDGSDPDMSAALAAALTGPAYPAAGHRDLLVKIELSADGKVDKLYVLGAVNADGTLIGGTEIGAKEAALATTFQFDTKAYRMTIGTTTYPVKDWVTALKATDDNGNFNASYDDTSFSALQDTQDKAGANGSFNGLVAVDDGNVVAVLVTRAPNVAISTKEKVGIITARQRLTNAYKFTMIVEGKETTYTTEDESVVTGAMAFVNDNEGTRTGRDADLNKGDVVAFTLNSKGEIDAMKELAVDTITVNGVVYRPVTDTVAGRVYYKVKDVDSKNGILTLSAQDPAGNWYNVTVNLSAGTDPDEKSYVFDYTNRTPKEISLSDISVDDEVQVFLFGNRYTGDARPDQAQVIKRVEK